MEDKKIEVFIAFDREDLIYLRELKNHLQPLATQGLIGIWDASEILGGEDWKQAITDHLKTASIILLLVSPSFLASREAYKLIQQSVAKSAPPEVYVVPILLQESYWEDSNIGKLAPLPTNGNFISSWPNRNAAYLDVVRGIREIVAKQQKAIAEKAIGASPSETEKVLVDSDELEYNIKDQPWYASNFPETIEIDREQIDTLKKEVDVVIITANDKELLAVMHLVDPYPRRRDILRALVGPETYYLGKFGVYKAVVTKCFQGATSAGAATLATNWALDVWHPRAVIMTGVAFGKDPVEQKTADVLVASQIIPYEQVRIGEQVVFRGAIPPSNAVLLNRFANAPTWRFTRPDGKDCTLLPPGPILSGEKLVDNLAFKLQLFQQFPQAIGGEMEGAGLCAASGRIGVAWILVKSICDWGDGKKHKKHQPLAAAAAASLVHHVLSQKNALDSI
jgi:nucleoside phosphorylase